MKLLIDADFTVYKNCASAEDEIDFGEDVIMVVSRFSEAYNNVKNEINKIKSNYLWDVPELILFFSDSVNFRKKIYADFKGSRQRKKPCGYKRVINKLRDEYELVIMPTLEADDAMGIYATTNPDCIICSPDKDMRQIPGRLNTLSETLVISEEEGYKWWLIQSLAGDQTDGYAGAPGFGVKTATKYLDANGYTWESIVEAYKSKGLSEDIALMKTRLAKILTANDYDTTRGEPILWSPDASGNTDNGTGPEDASDN